MTVTLSSELATWDAVFFDVDGVLIDSMDVKGEAFADTFPEAPLMRGSILEYHLANGGVNRAQKFSDLHLIVFGREATNDELDERIGAFTARVEDRVVAAPEMPGATDALRLWSELCPLYAVSATPSDELQRILWRRKITPYFRSVAGWPPEKSQLISGIVLRDGLTPSRCVLVGDSKQDLEAAQRTGLHFVQMARSVEDSFVEEDRVITDLRELTVALGPCSGQVTEKWFPGTPTLSEGAVAWHES